MKMNKKERESLRIVLKLADEGLEELSAIDGSMYPECARELKRKVKHCERISSWLMKEETQ